MRPTWSGALQFGLVTIPIRLYKAVNPQKTSFRLVHLKDNAPIAYRRFCKEEDEEVSWDEIGKALELDNGQTVVFSRDELKELRPERSQAVEIERFVDRASVTTTFYSSTYYAGPGDQGKEAFRLLMDAMREKDKAAIGRFVMREKEYTCLVHPHRDGLMLTTLHYPYEIRDSAQVPGVQDLPEPSERQRDLARDLIDKLTEDRPGLEQYTDTFIERLKDALEGKEAIEEPDRKAQSGDDLVHALSASLEA